MVIFPAFLENLSDFETNHLWVCFGIFVESTYEDGRKFYCEAVKGKDKKEERLKKFARGVGIFTALLFAGALIVALCNMILPELYRSIRNMVYTVPEQLNEWMERLSEMEFDDSTLR